MYDAAGYQSPYKFRDIFQRITYRLEEAKEIKGIPEDRHLENDRLGRAQDRINHVLTSAEHASVKKATKYEQLRNWVGVIKTQAQFLDSEDGATEDVDVDVIANELLQAFHKNRAELIGFEMDVMRELRNLAENKETPFSTRLLQMYCLEMKELDQRQKVLAHVVSQLDEVTKKHEIAFQENIELVSELEKRETQLKMYSNKDSYEEIQKSKKMKIVVDEWFVRKKKILDDIDTMTKDIKLYQNSEFEIPRMTKQVQDLERDVASLEKLYSDKDAEIRRDAELMRVYGEDQMRMTEKDLTFVRDQTLAREKKELKSQIKRIEVAHERMLNKLKKEAAGQSRAVAKEVKSAGEDVEKVISILTEDEAKTLTDMKKRFDSQIAEMEEIMKQNNMNHSVQFEREMRDRRLARTRLTRVLACQKERLELAMNDRKIEITAVEKQLSYIEGIVLDVSKIAQQLKIENDARRGIMKKKSDKNSDTKNEIQKEMNSSNVFVAKGTYIIQELRKRLDRKVEYARKWKQPKLNMKRSSSLPSLHVRFEPHSAPIPERLVEICLPPEPESQEEEEIEEIEEIITLEDGTKVTKKRKAKQPKPKRKMKIEKPPAYKSTKQRSGLTDDIDKSDGKPRSKQESNQEAPKKQIKSNKEHEEENPKPRNVVPNTFPITKTARKEFKKPTTPTRKRTNVDHIEDGNETIDEYEHDDVPEAQEDTLGDVSTPRDTSESVTRQPITLDAKQLTDQPCSNDETKLLHKGAYNSAEDYIDRPVFPGNDVNTDLYFDEADDYIDENGNLCHVYRAVEPDSDLSKYVYCESEDYIGADGKVHHVYRRKPCPQFKVSTLTGKDGVEKRVFRLESGQIADHDLCYDSDEDFYDCNGVLHHRYRRLEGTSMENFYYDPEDDFYDEKGRLHHLWKKKASRGKLAMSKSSPQLHEAKIVLAAVLRRTNSSFAMRGGTCLREKDVQRPKSEMEVKKVEMKEVRSIQKRIIRNRVQQSNVLEGRVRAGKYLPYICQSGSFIGAYGAQLVKQLIKARNALRAMNRVMEPTLPSTIPKDSQGFVIPPPKEHLEMVQQEAIEERKTAVQMHSWSAPSSPRIHHTTTIAAKRRVKLAPMTPRNKPSVQDLRQLNLYTTNGPQSPNFSSTGADLRLRKIMGERMLKERKTAKIITVRKTDTKREKKTNRT